MSQHHQYRQGGGGGTPQSIVGVDQNSGSSITSSVTPQQTNAYTTQHQRVSSGSGAGQDLQFGNFHAMHHQVPHPHQQRQQPTNQQQYNNPAYNHQHHHPYINNNSPASHPIDDAHYYNNNNNAAGLSDSGHYQTTGNNNNNAGSGWQQQQQPSSHHHHHHHSSSSSSLPASPYLYNGGQQQGGGGGVSVGANNTNSSATTTPLIGAAVGAGGGGSGHQHKNHQGGGIPNNSNNRNGRTRQLSLSSAMSSSRSRQNSATDFGNFAAATTSPTSASMPARRSSQQARNSPSFLYTNNSSNTPTSPSFQHSNNTFGANNSDATDRNSAGGGHRRFSSATGGGGGHNHHHHNNGGGGGIPPTSPVALLAVSPHPDRASLPDIIIARAFDGDYGDDAENNNHHHSNSQSPATTPATTDLLPVARRKSSPQEPEDPLDNTCTFDTDTKKGEEDNNEGEGDNDNDEEGDENTLVAVMPTNRVHVRSARIVSTAVTKATLLRGDGIVCGDFFQRPGCALGAECTKIHVVGREHVWEPISLPSDLLTRWSRPTSDSRTAAVVAALDASIPAASITSTKDGDVDSASNRATEDPLEGTTSKVSHKPSTITSSEAAETYKLRAVQYPSGFNLFTYDTSMTTYLRIPSERIERTLGSEMFIECYNEFGGNFKTQFSLCSDFDPAIDMTFEGASSGCNVNRGNLDGSRAHQLSTTQSSLVGASISNMSTGGVADEEEDELRAVEPRPRRGCALGAQCPRIHCLEFDPVVSCKYSQTHMVLDEDVESFTAGRSEYDRDHGQHAAVHYYLPLGSGQTGDQQGNSHHHRSQRSSAGQRAAQLASPAYLTTTTVSMFASLPTPPQLCPWYSRLSSSIPSMVDAAAQQSVHRSHHHHRRRSSAASHQTATTTAADGSSEKNSTAATAPTTVVDLPRYYVRVYPQNCPPNVRDDFEDIPIDAVLVTEGSNCFLRALRSFVTKATQSSVAVSGKTSRKQSAIDAAEAAKAAAAAGRRGSSKTESPTTTHLTAVSPQSSRRVSIQSSSQQRRATLRLAVQVTPNDHVIVTPSTIKQPQHCAHFRLKQLCRKGPDCRFVHVLPGYPTTRLAGGGGGVSPSLGRSPQDAHLGFSGNNNNNARRVSKPFGNNNRSHPSSPLQQDFGNIENNSLRGSLNLGASGNGERGSGHHQHPNNRRQQHHNNNTNATTGNNNNTAGAERSGGGGGGSYHNSYHQSYPHSREHSTASQEYGGFDSSGYGQAQHIYADPHYNHQYQNNNNHAEINGVGVGDYSQQDWHHQQQHQYHHTQQQQQYGGGGGYHQQQQMQQGGGGDHSWPPSPHQYHIPPSPSSQQTPTLGSSMNNISPLPSQVQGSDAANRLTAVNSVTNSPSDAQLGVSPTRSPTTRTNNPYRFN